MKELQSIISYNDNDKMDVSNDCLNRDMLIKSESECIVSNGEYWSCTMLKKNQKIEKTDTDMMIVTWVMNVV